MKYEQIMVIVPKVGTILKKYDKSYYIISTATYQENSGDMVTKATCLEIDPETRKDLGKETEIIEIPAFPAYM